MYMDLRARDNLGMPLSNENFTDIRNGSKGSFEDMAAVRTLRQVMPGADGTPEQVRLGFVTANFFSVVGGRIAQGRDFTEADGLPQPLQQLPGAQPNTPGPPRCRSSPFSATNTGSAATAARATLSASGFRRDRDPKSSACSRRSSR